MSETLLKKRTRSKQIKSKQSVKKKQKTKQDDEQMEWEISKNRKVIVSEFRGKLFVNIREFYVDNNGETKPGKKGIALNLDQWKKFSSVIPEIEDTIKILTNEEDDEEKIEEEVEENNDSE